MSVVTTPPWCRRLGAWPVAMESGRARSPNAAVLAAPSRSRWAPTRSDGPWGFIQEPSVLIGPAGLLALLALLRLLLFGHPGLLPSGANHHSLGPSGQSLPSPADLRRSASPRWHERGVRQSGSEGQAHRIRRDPDRGRTLRP